jgi:hypothetical protein
MSVIRSVAAHWHTVLIKEEAENEGKKGDFMMSDDDDDFFFLSFHFY